MTKQIKFLVLMLTICSLAFFSSTCKKKPPVVIKPKDTTKTTATYTGDLRVYVHIYTIAGPSAGNAQVNIYLTQDSMDNKQIFKTVSTTDNGATGIYALFTQIPTFSVANKTRQVFIDCTYNYGGQDLYGLGVQPVCTANKEATNQAASNTIVVAP